MIPQTVPKSPIKGVTAPVVANQGKRDSMRVSSSEAAICVARWIDARLRGAPPPVVCRRYSSKPCSKMLTSGLGLNCSDTADTSCNLSAFRKARRNLLLCTRARRKLAHFDRMMDQEIRLKISRTSRTVFATGPVCWIKLPISPTAYVAIKEWGVIIAPLKVANQHSIAKQRKCFDLSMLDYEIGTFP